MQTGLGEPDPGPESCSPIQAFLPRPALRHCPEVGLDVLALLDGRLNVQPEIRLMYFGFKVLSPVKPPCAVT